MISLGISNIVETAVEAENLVRLNASPPPDDDWWYGPVAAASVTGQRINEQTAMSFDAVWACVTLISETVGSLPLHLYRELGDAGKQKASEHPLYRIIHDRPNSEQTAMEFWTTMLQHVLLYGNAYARIRYTARRDVESLRIIHPCRMEIKRDDTTGAKYYVYQPPGAKPRQVLFDDDIFHLPGQVLDEDGLYGLSPIAAHRRQIELAMGGDEYRLRYLANNARPGMYISHPQKLSEEAVKRLRESWMQVHAGLQNAGKPGILEEGMKIETVGGINKDLEFLGLMKFDVEKVARLYRVPLHMIQSLDRATFSNIEHQGIEAAVYTFRPWCERIEERIELHLLGEREGLNYTPEFVLEGLLRGDSAGRATFYTAMRNSGIMTANEIRARENLNPAEGGDELFIQGAMVPISMAGKMPSQQQQKKTANKAQMALFEEEVAQ